MQEYNIKSKFLLDITDENIETKNLIKKEKNDCILFKYDRNQNLENINEIYECRGIIIKDSKFICLPPSKSLNNNDFFSTNNFNDCLQEEFIDGTMVNIYRNNDKVYFSTRSQIDANDKNYGILNKTFREMFMEVYNEYGFSLEEKLPKDICLSCVLCHKDNTIVKKHNENKIYLVEAKKILENNKYSNIPIHDSEILKDILFDRPQIFSFQNMKEIKIYLKNQNYEYKGLMLKNGNVKTKIENKKYLEIKNLRRLDIKNTKILYYTLKKNNQIKKFTKLFPNYISIFSDYKKEYENLINFLYKSYRQRWVIHDKDKVNSISDLKYECRPIIHGLHKKYLENREIITKEVINNYVMDLEIHSLFHTLKVLN